MKMMVIYIVNVCFPYPETEIQPIRTMCAVDVMLSVFQILMLFQKAYIADMERMVVDKWQYMMEKDVFHYISIVLYFYMVLTG